VRAWLAILALALGTAPAAHGAELLLATTTSVRDSGLLDELLPVFTGETGIRVRAVAVGTGAALRMGARGDADVLLSHAPQGERELVESGAAVSRQPFMENHFVIAGPADDPADVAGAQSAAEALRRIAAARAAFVSRADDSGTHRREASLWRAAGLDPDAEWPGFVRTGSGMGLALQVAGERRAYLLSDIGTFLAFEARIGLAALSRPSPELRNEYSLLRVNPSLAPGRIDGERTRAFETFLLKPATQRRIAAFGVERFGRPLFRPLLPVRDD
jgi:tungstate transport system substrate-binding protein